MYQTVGHQGIDLYAEAMDLPLYREVISGVAIDQGKNYKPTENDEVEDLYRLLLRVKVSINATLYSSIVDYEIFYKEKKIIILSGVSIFAKYNLDSMN